VRERERERERYFPINPLLIFQTQTHLFVPKHDYTFRAAQTIIRPPIQNFQNKAKCGAFTIFVNNQLDAQLFSMYIFFYSLHVSGSHVPIIRRINCINTTFGICHYV